MYKVTIMRIRHIVRYYRKSYCETLSHIFTLRWKNTSKRKQICLDVNKKRKSGLACPKSGRQEFVDFSFAPQSTWVVALYVVYLDIKVHIGVWAAAPAFVIPSAGLLKRNPPALPAHSGEGGSPLLIPAWILPLHESPGDPRQQKSMYGCSEQFSRFCKTNLWSMSWFSAIEPSFDQPAPVNNMRGPCSLYQPVKWRQGANHFP